MEYLKTKKQRRIVVPKKKKAKKKLYFGMEVQDAIVRYNALDPVENQSERNKIYSEEIHKAFDKLCENIINTFKFEYFDDVYIDVKHETLAFLVMNIHKYDHTKGSKAFSYFSVVAKNYLILHNNANYKRYKSHRDISLLDMKVNNSGGYDKKIYIEEFMEELITYFEENIPKIFNNKKDIDIAFAILELMKQREDIENFNKKALYILIREMADVNTSHITKVTNTMKQHYKKLLIKFDRHGTIVDDDINNFFS